MELEKRITINHTFYRFNTSADSQPHWEEFIKYFKLAIEKKYPEVNCNLEILDLVGEEPEWTGTGFQNNTEEFEILEECDRMTSTVMFVLDLIWYLKTNKS